MTPFSQSDSTCRDDSAPDVGDGVSRPFGRDDA